MNTSLKAILWRTSIGTQMKYRRKTDQNFVLYSVGWNESDEGGITVPDRDGNEDRESGDWVWHYPE